MKQAEVLVIGSGVMGRGIAKSFAAAGIPSAILTRNRANATGIDKRVALTEKLPETTPKLVIESIPEVVALKHACYAELEEKYQGGCVIGSNTSGLDLELLAGPLKYPAKFLAIHYFMPADVMPQVELAPGSKTDPASYELAAGYLERAGKQAVRLGKAVPGLLLNRLQHAILHEAYYLISEGVCTAEQIDAFARESYGPRMCIAGLIKQKDISGLDTHALVQRALVPYLCHSAEPQRPLQDLYDAGHLGLKTGKGFYDWSGEDPNEVKAEAARKLTELLTFLKQLG
jgi:3-hydroxybutyryl-CoA dehydrogenase